MLKNLSGIEKEKEISKVFHKEGTPFLISPIVLRDRNLGQVDVARLKDHVIEIGEVKQSARGISLTQRKRLYGAMIFLSGLLGKEVKLIEILG